MNEENYVKIIDVAIPHLIGLFPVIIAPIFSDDNRLINGWFFLINNNIKQVDEVHLFAFSVNSIYINRLWGFNCLGKALI